MYARAYAVLLLVAVGLGISSPPCVAQDHVPSATSNTNELAPRPDAAILAALDSPSDFAYQETPLGEVIADWRERFGINIWVDEQALKDVGVTLEQPIDFEATQFMFENALDFILIPHRMTIVIQDNLLVVTSNEEGSKILQTRVYQAADLMFRPLEDHQAFADDITKLIVNTIDPVSWERIGGRGSVIPFHADGIDVLVVTQTWKNHRRLERLLLELRLARKTSDEAAVSNSGTGTLLPLEAIPVEQPAPEPPVQPVPELPIDNPFGNTDPSGRRIPFAEDTIAPVDSTVADPENGTSRWIGNLRQGESLEVRFLWIQSPVKIQTYSILFGGAGGRNVTVTMTPNEGESYTAELRLTEQGVCALDSLLAWQRGRGGQTHEVVPYDEAFDKAGIGFGKQIFVWMQGDDVCEIESFLNRDPDDVLLTFRRVIAMVFRFPPPIPVVG